jgi:hypothetical protein
VLGEPVQQYIFVNKGAKPVRGAKLDVGRDCIGNMVTA